MKKLLIVMLSFFIFPVQCGDMSYEAGYATVAGVIGFFTTVGSWTVWYFHQQGLKRDFARKKSEMEHRIHQLEDALGVAPVPNPNVRFVNTPPEIVAESVAGGISVSREGMENDIPFGPPPGYDDDSYLALSPLYHPHVSAQAGDDMLATLAMQQLTPRPLRGSLSPSPLTGLEDEEA